jgi:ABC-type dipeptide/oligopeptide/nickel transport system ATPase component
MDAVPVPDPDAAHPAASSDPPPDSSDVGCAFSSRCTYRIPRCASEGPELRPAGTGEAACHRASELDLRR